MDLGTLTVSLVADTKGLMAAQMAMGSFSKQTIASINTVSQRFRTFGYLATAALTVPIIAGGKAVAKLAMEYEASLSKIVGLVGMSREQVAIWSKEMLAMAPKVAKSPKELADALYFITSAGIRGAESMEVLEMAAKGSAAGLGETRVVADLVSSAMNAYGKEFLTAAMATDVLTATVREGKAEASALASSMGMVLPIAAAMGVSFDQVGAGMAAMTRTGTSAATSAMQMRQILNSLIKPARQAEKALNAMGTSSKELRTTIREDGLLTALMDIKNLTNKFGEELMARVFGNIRALSGVLDMMGENIEDNIAIFDSLSKSTGSLAAAFAAASETLKFKFNAALSKVQVSMRSIGQYVAEFILPIFQRLADWVSKIAKRFDELSDRQRRNRLRMLGLIAALGPLSLIISILGYTYSGLMVAINGVTAAMWRLSAATLANPLFAVGTILVALSAQWLIYRSRISKAVTTQYELNDELKKGGQLMADLNKVLTTANASKIMTFTQLKSVKAQLEQKLEAEKMYTVELAGEAIKRIKNDEKSARLSNQITAATNELYKGVLRNKLKNHQEFITRDLNAEFQASKKRVNITENTLLRINKLWAEASEKDTVAQAWLEEQANIDEIFAKVEAGVLTIQRARNMLGKDFDVLEAKSTLFKSALMELAETGIPLTSGRLEELIDKFKEIKKELNATNTAFERLEALTIKYKQREKPEYKLPTFEETNYERMFKQTGQSGFGDTQSESVRAAEREIASLIYMNQVFGDGLGDITGQMNVYKNIVGQLASTDEFRVGNPETIAALDILLERYNLLEEEMEGMAGITSKLANSLSRTFEKMFLEIGGGFKGMVQAMMDSLKLLIAQLAGKAVLFTILTLLSGGTAAGAGVLAKWAKASLGGKGLLSFLGFGGAVEAAAGGLVPSGYPNDTYPALLSSGETVIPAGVSAGLKNKPIDINLTGSVEIDGDVLQIVLRRGNESN